MDKILPPDTQHELLQCFTEHGEVATPRPRGEVHTEPLMFWHGVVNIWLVNSQGEVLCSKRSEHVKGNPGKWQTYFGGHIKAGSTFAGTALAELSEEVGLVVEEQQLHLIDKGVYEPAKHFYESYVYIFNGPVETLRFSDGEIDAVQWFTIDNYWQEKEMRPEQWCNNMLPENQERIKAYLHSLK